MAHFLFLVRVVITCLLLMSNRDIIQPKILSGLKRCDFNFQPPRVGTKEASFPYKIPVSDTGDTRFLCGGEGKIGESHLRVSVTH